MNPVFHRPFAPLFLLAAPWVAASDPAGDPPASSLWGLEDAVCSAYEREDYSAALAAVEAPRGRLIVIDYTPKPCEEHPWGSPPEQQIPLETPRAELATAGLNPEKIHDFAPERHFVSTALKPGIPSPGKLKRDKSEGRPTVAGGSGRQGGSREGRIRSGSADRPRGRAPRSRIRGGAAATRPVRRR